MAQEGSRTADTRRGIYECNSKGCICCKHILKGSNQFQSAATGNQYEITQSLTCKTPSVIYVIQCKECKVQYVGKTSTTLQKRFKDHRSSIRQRRKRPISDHFTKNGHCLDDLIVYPIECVTGSKALSDRELHWIRELETVENGLNLGPYECVRQQSQDDGDKRPVEPTEGQVEAPQRGKRKLRGNEDVKLKKRKMKNNGQSVFSYETEELLSTCEDALQDGKDAMSQVYDKLKGVSCRENSFLEDLKEKISSLKDYNQKEKIYIGFFGKTGAGKSSLINAIVEEKLLPSRSLQACTSVFVHVQANTEPSEYKAEIEFIRAEDWESELRFLLDSLKNENDQQNKTAAKDDEIAEMAREKITAIYGEEGLEKDYSALAREVPVIPRTKTLTFHTVEKLSKSIGCYIRSDTDEQFWPLVKRVTISLPKSPALLEGIVLVDLPGAGDVSKCRSDMWKECLSQCSSVWIVNEMNRALSEKVADEIFDTSLRTIAGGGECHNITFICTKTDVIKPKEIKENYDITDEDLEIEGNIDKKTSEYEKKEKQACILYRNKIFKEEISKVFKNKTKKFLLGDEDHSNEYFHVNTVSSEEFKKIAQGKSTVLDHNETELPALMEHIKKLYVSHFKKEVKDNVSEVSGIISYLHFSKDALSSKKQSSNDEEFNRLEKDLGDTYRRLNKNLSTVHTVLQEKLEMGAMTAETTCLENATAKVLESRGSDNRGHHKTLKALCRNDGYYRSRKGVLVDLNYTLSEPMYKKMNEDNYFQKIFGTGPSETSFKKTRATSIQAQFESFQENFITNDYLKVRMNNKEKYLRLVYIRTEQRKVHRKLEKEILQRKKLIYNSLSDSIRDTMKQTYQECSGITGKDSFREIQKKLKRAIEDFKKTMFHNAKTKMLKEFSDLQIYLVDQIKTQMTNALTLGLNQIPEDLAGLPDVSEEKAMMERCCESLGLQVF